MHSEHPMPPTESSRYGRGVFTGIHTMATGGNKQRGRQHVDVLGKPTKLLGLKVGGETMEWLVDHRLNAHPTAQMFSKCWCQRGSSSRRWCRRAVFDVCLNRAEDDAGVNTATVSTISKGARCLPCPGCGTPAVALSKKKRTSQRTTERHPREMIHDVWCGETMNQLPHPRDSI